MYEQLDRPSAEIEKQVRLAFNAPKFNLYFVEIAQRLLEKGLDDELSFVIARKMIYTMPVPKIDKPYAVARTLQKANPDLAPSALRFGQGFYKAAWPLTHPGVEMPEVTSRPVGILLRESRENTERIYGTEAILGSISTVPGDCSRENIKALLERQRRAFLEFKSSVGQSNRSSGF